MEGRLTGVNVDPEAIRKARQKAGMSMAQVAEPRLTRQAIHLFETGKVRPSWDSLEHIAGRLGLPVTDFLRTDARVADQIESLRELAQDERHNDALELATSLIDSEPPRRALAVAHLHAGIALCQLDRTVDGLAHLRTARELASAPPHPDPWLVAESLDWLGAGLQLIDIGQAVELGQAALRTYRALERRRPEVEARMLVHLATGWAARDTPDRAQECIAEALQLAGGAADLETIASVYEGRARTLQLAADLVGAADALRRAVALRSIRVDLQPERPSLALARTEAELGRLLGEASAAG
jgi:transcriptional regulator with XRE-family HTH domain